MNIKENNHLLTANAQYFPFDLTNSEEFRRSQPDTQIQMDEAAERSGS